MSIYQLWLNAKKAERLVVNVRRGFEDMMVAEFGIPEDFECTKNINIDDLKIQIVGRMNKVVNSDKLLELAAEHGLSDHLETLFRWKPEVSVAAWKNADVSITAPLADAITTTSSRPTFKITVKE